jgi:hypothetical protein
MRLLDLFHIPDNIESFEFVISRNGSDEKSKRSLVLLEIWISPFGRNDSKSAL